MSYYKFSIATVILSIVTGSAPAMAGDGSRASEAYRASVLNPSGSDSTVAARHRDLEHPANVFIQPDASRFKTGHATD